MLKLLAYWVLPLAVGLLALAVLLGVVYGWPPLALRYLVSCMAAAAAGWWLASAGERMRGGPGRHR